MARLTESDVESAALAWLESLGWRVTHGLDITPGEPTLRGIARELLASVRANVTIDWTVRENVRAQLRVLVKRILRKHGRPPDKQEKATLSDKTARKEFGLTQDEIVQAIRAGELHYREASMHGNPWLRLLRREVEALVKKKHGDNYLKDQQAKTEPGNINCELKRLKTQVAVLEERKARLMADLGPRSSSSRA